MRVGIGHDTHRLGQGGPLRLGGIDIPHDRHLIGHSDADVLLHAITDALLGAAALGDIGELFPDTDAANRGRDSAEMLRQAARAVRRAGYQIVNLDCIVFAQRPKLSPHKDAIRQPHRRDPRPRRPTRSASKPRRAKASAKSAAKKSSMAQCVALLDGSSSKHTEH